MPAADNILPMLERTALSELASSAAAANIMKSIPNGQPLAVLPRSAQANYQAVVTDGGKQTMLPANLNWRYDGSYYDLRFTLYGTVIGERSRYSAGLITSRGLAPVTARSASAPAYNLTFDYTQMRLRSWPQLSAIFATSVAATDASLAISGSNAAAEPSLDTLGLQAGTQDPLSLVIQLGALIAGNPSQYVAGYRFSLPVINGTTDPEGPPAKLMEFTVVDDKNFVASGQFEGQPMPAVHLVHEPQNEQDVRIELWLGKLLDYLPLRQIITESNGNQIDITVRDAHTQSVLRASPQAPQPKMSPAQSPPKPIQSVPTPSSEPASASSPASSPASNPTGEGEGG
jgi:hypothetical protein